MLAAKEGFLSSFGKIGFTVCILIKQVGANHLSRLVLGPGRPAAAAP